jgi:fructosamine-3-kinase
VASSPTWLARVSRALGEPTALRRLAGGAWRFEAGGRALVAKAGPGARDEAAGLAHLAGAVGGPPVPTVVLVDDDLLVTVAVETGDRTAVAEERLGRALARLHAGPWPTWGGGSRWVGACRVENGEQLDGAQFYGRRLSELAARCGLEAHVSRVMDRLDRLVPAGPPALVHGDLWWGNVIWGRHDRAWLIDPSTHGGHPEEDLAMLALFGAVPDGLRRAYHEVLPPVTGWREREALFQLASLLVHAVLFGGGYRSQAEAVARRYG